MKHETPHADKEMKDEENIFTLNYKYSVSKHSKF